VSQAAKIHLLVGISMTYDLIPWRGRYLQSAPRFEFGVLAICKARPDLYLACSLFAKRLRICIWHARYFQSAILKSVFGTARRRFTNP